MLEARFQPLLSRSKDMRRIISLFVFAIAALIITPANLCVQDDVKIKVRDKVPIKAYPFDLRDVRLLDGPFREAMLRDQKFILGLDNDRLLHIFRVNAGLPSSATPYGGWEAPNVELRGHSLGHFLTACALMYSSTGDERFKVKANAVVAELAKVQQALTAKGFDAGYLS